MVSISAGSAGASRKALGGAVRRNRIRRTAAGNSEIAPTGDCPGMGHRDSSAQLGSHGGFFGAGAGVAEAASPSSRRLEPERQTAPIDGASEIGRGLDAAAAGALLYHFPLAVLRRGLQVPSIVLELRLWKPSLAMAPRGDCRSRWQATAALPSLHQGRIRSGAGNYPNTSSICRESRMSPSIACRALRVNRSERDVRPDARNSFS